MHSQFERTALLLGEEAIDRLNKKTVAVFGIGGVGSFACEALARSGVGNFLLIDHDIVTVTNINRQLIATYETIGQPKVNIMKQRIKTINPTATVEVMESFFDTTTKIPFEKLDYIVDAIDSVPSKAELIEKSISNNTPIISCMGAGNKFEPTLFKVGDIYETTNCPLAKVMRKELRNRGIEKLKVVYSTEQPKKVFYSASEKFAKKPPGSLPFVTSVAGLILAKEVIMDLINFN